MTLACQRDCYLKTLETEVLSCSQVENTVKNALRSNDPYYCTVLEDTILFPEGGGQPCDFGAINGVDVFNVIKQHGQVLHMTKHSLEVGSKATVDVDWKRRFDHMQQHSGQHLITAVAETLLNYSTTSWNLGEEVSSIELDTPSLDSKDISKLETEINEKIRQCIPVTVHLYKKNSPELAHIRTRFEIPDDNIEKENDIVRVIDIKDIDTNACCGTHVKNTSELQAVKLLFSAKGKKNKSNLFFVVGGRVLSYLGESVYREKSLNTILGSCSSNLVPAVEKLQKTLKVLNKSVISMSRDFGALEAKVFKLLDPCPRFHSIHRTNVDSDFISVFLADVEFQKTGTLFLLTVGDGKLSGHVTLAGPEKLVAEYGPKVSDLLQCKGAVKHGKFQGKINSYSNISELENILKNAICK